MFVNDNIIKAGGLGTVFRILGKALLRQVKN